MSGPGSQRRGARGWSVRSRILTSILVVAALGLAAAGAITFLVQRDRVLAGMDESLLSRVEAARFVVTGSAANRDPAAASPADAAAFANSSEALEAVLARVIPTRGESALGIVDGRAAFVPGVRLDFHLEDVPGFVGRVVRETADGSVRLGTERTATASYRYIAVPLSVPGDPQEPLYVAAIDIDVQLSQLSSAFSTYLVIALASLVAIGLVGWFVAGRLLRPIRQLDAAASRITVSALHERIPVTGRDDVSGLTRTINDMLERLDQAVAGQRQLLDDVRHELKTPLTIVRGHLELLDTADQAEVAATRQLALEELDRMSGLVDDIESLVVTRSAVVAVRSDVADFTADVFAKAQGISGHDWALVDTAQAIVAIDPNRLTQAWLQLADNAAKYSPPGSRIELGSTGIIDREIGPAVEFWVSDRGPGIAPEAFERIFERFGRADVGRGIRGSGLGLAIVKAIALAHGGRVSLSSSPSGSRFGLVVPFEAADIHAPDAPGTGAPENGRHDDRHDEGSRT